MIILSDKLTTGEITFILRIAIQILSFAGLYILGRIVLGNAPRIAPLETHDVLNRFVGKSTITLSTLRWMWRRITRKGKDPTPSFALAFGLALALLYSITVTVSDIGLIGVRSCTVAGASREDFPASIRSDSDALALVSQNLLNGTDPQNVKSYRCEGPVAQDVPYNYFSGNAQPPATCTSWVNSTYGEGSAFVTLNSTDSDILMPRNLAEDSLVNLTQAVNLYFMTTAGKAMVEEATIQGGLVVIPHETGVQMVAGVPQLSTQERVDIPNTLALEVEVGCMALGIFGEKEARENAAEWFIPDALYLTEETNSTNYAGPSNLQAPLTVAAGQFRSAFLPAYDTQHPDTVTGYYPGGVDFPSSVSGQYDWPFEVTIWDPPFNQTTVSDPVTLNCTLELQSSLNVAGVAQGRYSFPTSCQVFLMEGSVIRDGLPIQKHEAMICATTTQVNRVSATVEVDASGVVTGNLTRLPSNLTVVQGNWDFSYESSDFDPLVRFTLSDDPLGPLHHYIYQEIQPSKTGEFSEGSGSIGAVFLHVASYVLSLPEPGLGIIDSDYFTANFTAGRLTKWAGAVGASYVIGSVGYNGWAARGSNSLTVVSTGGQSATCYNPGYALGFVPLIAATIFILSWALVMLMTTRLQEASRLEKDYGGLAPHIDLPFPEKLSLHTWLEWTKGPEPYLRPVKEKSHEDDIESEATSLVFEAGNVLERTWRISD